MSDDDHKDTAPFLSNAGHKIEFSRVVDVTNLGAKGRHFKFQATEEEQDALRERYSVVAVQNLTAECSLIPHGKGRFKMEAVFRAKIIQECGISLEPVTEDISNSFIITLHQNNKKNNKEETEIDFEIDEDDIEYLTSTSVDMGDLIAQYISLEINPYPRKEDATGKELGKEIIQDDDLSLVTEKKNPFAILKSLKHKT